MPLFHGLCEEQIKLHIEPDLIKTRKNQRKIELEVADIKSKLNASNGKNVVLSNREIRLLRFDLKCCIFAADCAPHKSSRKF